MSEVSCQPGANHTPESGSPPTNMAAPVAPALRVEVLKVEEIEGASSTCGSEDEGAIHGTGSDLDRSLETQEEFIPPSEELKERIITQVEFYFSDVNILKDTFLLKHVRRNKLGYVSIKLITSFKKVKSMTKDYRVVAYSLRQSDKLEVNEEGTKVRRKDPLPDYDETTPSRTIVAVNLPTENPTIENVAELFSKCGEIALVRILKPGKVIPQDVKRYMNKHPEIGNTMCAVVEFETHEAAKMAVENMTNTEDWRKGMRVVLLAVAKKGKEKKMKDEGKREDGRSEGEGGKSGEDGDAAAEKKRRKRGARKKRGSRVEELSHEVEHSTTSGSEGEGTDSSPGNSRPSSANRQRRDSWGRTGNNSLSPQMDPNRLSPNSTPRTTPYNSPRSSPRGSPNMRRRNPPGRSPLADSPGDQKLSPGSSPDPSRKAQEPLNDSGGSSPSSPWVQRRLKAQQEISPLAHSPGASPRLGRRLADGSLPDGAPPPRMADLMGVVRQPQGPDGTKGFYGGKGRGQPIVASS